MVQVDNRSAEVKRADRSMEAAAETAEAFFDWAEEVLSGDDGSPLRPKERWPRIIAIAVAASALAARNPAKREAAQMAQDMEGRIATIIERRERQARHVARRQAEAQGADLETTSEADLFDEEE